MSEKKGRDWELTQQAAQQKIKWEGAAAVEKPRLKHMGAELRKELVDEVAKPQAAPPGVDVRAPNCVVCPLEAWNPK